MVYENNDFLMYVRTHRKRLERRIAEYMEADEDARNTSGLGIMIDCWERLYHMENKISKCTLGLEEMNKWMSGIKNYDGTVGAHWTLEQTSSVAKSTGVMMHHITPEDFWVVMNVMYSDYSMVAEKYNVNKPEFYAELAKCFLFDKDGPAPEKKLAAYYCEIVRNGN